MISRNSKKKLKKQEIHQNALEKNEGEIKNGQYRNTGNIGHTPQDVDKQSKTNKNINKTKQNTGN